MFTRAWLIDVSERTVITFLQAFVAALALAGTGAVSVGTLHAAALGGLAAALAFVKGVLASAITRTPSASLASRKSLTRRLYGGPVHGAIDGYKTPRAAVAAKKPAKKAAARKR